MSAKLTRHGHARQLVPHTPEYRAWAAMIRRCCYPSQPQYRYYGGRGIVVCPAWRHSFETFLRDVGPMPTEGQWSLDRINPDGNYEPGNVRWATREEQNNNKRTNRFITHAGRTQTVAQWSRETGLTSAAIVGRLNTGWPPAKALTTPLNVT